MLSMLSRACSGKGWAIVMAEVIPKDVLGKDTCESGSLGLSICGYNFSIFSRFILETYSPKDYRKAVHQVSQREVHEVPLVIYGWSDLAAVRIARPGR